MQYLVPAVDEAGMVIMQLCELVFSGINGVVTAPEFPQPAPNVVSLGPAVVDGVTEYE